MALGLATSTCSSVSRARRGAGNTALFLRGLLRLPLLRLGPALRVLISKLLPLLGSTPLGFLCGLLLAGLRLLLGLRPFLGILCRQLLTLSGLGLLLGLGCLILLHRGGLQPTQRLFWRGWL